MVAGAAPAVEPHDDAGDAPRHSENIELRVGGPALRGHPVHTARWLGGGTGPPVVMVHGLAGSHLNWTHLGPQLAARLDTRELWAPDLAGFGRTPPVAGHATVALQVQLLDAFLATVAPDEPSVVIGNSMGGLAALLHAARHPAKVTALALIAPATPIPAGRLPDTQIGTQLGAIATPVLGPRLASEWLARHRAEDHVDTHLRLCGIDPERFWDPDRAERIELLAERQRAPHTATTLVESTRSTLAHVIGPARGRVWEAVDRVTPPVLVIHGGRDRLVPVRASVALATRRQDWTLRIHPAYGHTPMMDAADIIATDVETWRASHRSSSRRRT